MLRKGFAGACVLLALAAAAFAQAPPYGHIGLYADVDHSVNEVSYAGGTTEFTMYIYCRPSERGMICAEFAIDYPDNVVPGEITENPGVSVFSGELETGMSFCFYECQNDWVWTHHQTLYLTNGLSSQLAVVPHPLTSVYQFANCLEGFPTEPVFYNSPICLNCSYPPDETPPTLLDATATASRRVVAAFNEELFKVTSEDVGNYEIFETINPVNTIPVTGVYFLEDQTAVRLSLGFSLIEGLYYTLRVSGLYDIAGNKIVSGSEIIFAGIDMEPPTIVHAVTPDKAALNITYSERVLKSTAENLSNYGLSENPLTPGAHITGAELISVGMTVWLSFSEPLAGGSIYTLTVSDVVDLSGNVIAPNSTIDFEVVDNDPPEILSVEGIYFTRIEITFNETLSDATWSDISNYLVYEMADTTNVFTVQDVSAVQQVPEYIVTLFLVDSLVSGTSYTVGVSGVEDLAGHPIAPGSEAEFLFAERVPPRIEEASVLADSLIELVFNEPMDSVTAGDEANFAVFEEGKESNSIPVTEAELQPDGFSVRLSLGGYLALSVPYVIQVSNVEDVAGNPIPFRTRVRIINPDVYPPELMSVTVIDSVTLDIAFNEALQAGTAGNDAYYRVYRAGSPMDSIPIAAAALKGDLVTVRLSLAAFPEIGVPYVLQVSGIEDLAGNPIIPGSEIGFTVYDTTPPELVAISAPSSLLVEVTFSEPLDNWTAETAGNYTLFELYRADNTLGITNAALDAGGMKVCLSLGGELSFAVSYVLRVNGVRDLAGVPITTNSEIVLYEIRPPELSAVTLEGMNYLRITFDEPVSSSTALDVTNYHLHKAGYPSNSTDIDHAEMLTGAVYGLSLSEPLVHETSYILHADGVEDRAGNPVIPGSAITFTAYDTWPPWLESADALTDNSVSVYFSEEINTASAENLSNYELFETLAPSNAVTILAADAFPGGESVMLSLEEELAAGWLYTIRVSNVEDLAGNMISGNSECTFTYAIPPLPGHIGLYLDEDHMETDIDVENYVPFTYFVWCRPGGNGMMCAEFAIRHSNNVIPSTGTANEPMISVSMGELPSGISVCMVGCQLDWVWTHRQQCYMGDSEIGLIEVIPDPAVSFLQFANCLPGYPIEQVHTMSSIHINMDHVDTPLQSSSASYRRSEIEVTWTLAREIKNAKFIVSRSDGVDGDFSELVSQIINKEGLTFTFVDSEIKFGESYRYRIEYATGEARKLLFETEPVATPALPLTLYQNRPNPFNPSTVIGFYLPEGKRVVLDVYDVTGRKVVMLINGFREKGWHEVEWDGRDSSGNMASTGIYFYRLVAGDFVQTKKMVLLR